MLSRVNQKSASLESADGPKQNHPANSTRNDQLFSD